MLWSAPVMAQPLPASLRSAGISETQWSALQADVRRSAARANISERALAAVAERLGLALAEGGRHVDAGEILGQLDALATRIAELETRLAVLARDEDPAIAAYVARARAAVAVGDLVAADAALAQARRARAERNALLQARLDSGRLDEAGIVAAQAEVAVLRADYLGAAALYAEAAELAPESARERWAYRIEQGRSLYERGQRFDIEHLREAARVYEHLALPLSPRATRANEWGVTQVNLGNTLMRLGERGEPGALERATAAYDAALAVLTRESDPMGWAAAQSNLGFALSVTGERGAPGALERAVAAYEAALTVQTRTAYPEHWAVTQTNLGNALLRLGQNGVPGALERAIAAYDAAIIVLTREADPAGWAATQGNLGAAYQFQGDFARAIASYQAALTVRTREADPAGWADTTYSLAFAYRAMGRDRDARNAAQGALAVYEQVGNAYWADAARGFIAALPAQ